MNELTNFLTKKIDLNDDVTVVIGLSGGPDSMALLDIIHKFNKNVKIVCAHVHHNLRKESDNEKIFVEEYCKKNNFKFEFLKIENYKNNKFTEEEARKIRYDFFESIVLKYKAKYLFTAHHGDDLIETVLMRLTRGSTLKGYSGISTITKKENYDIVRPLIFLTKSQILDYINNNHIPYVTDNSNASLKYTRNRYRINILPNLKNENINVHQKFYKYNQMLESYDNFVNSYVDKIYNDIVQNNKIIINLFIKEDKLIQKLLLEKYIYTFYGDDIVYMDDTKTNLIMNLLENNKPNVQIDLPNNLLAVKEYEYLYLKIKVPNNEYNYLFEDILYINDKVIERVSDCDLKDNFVTYLNSCDIKLPLYVRSYQNGDKIKIKNMKNEKKLKDIFINEKIPLTLRKQWPVVVDSDNNILWLPGLKKSNFDSQNTGKYDIILRYY